MKTVSKSQRGIDLIEHDGLSIYEAARRVDMSYSVLYRAVKRKQAGGYSTCPTCGEIRTRNSKLAGLG